MYSMSVSSSAPQRLSFPSKTKSIVDEKYFLPPHGILALGILVVLEKFFDSNVTFESWIFIFELNNQ